ncbi:hypothetical protein C6496_13925 [Candidatus Poribacteria bacterium]|nr:MAG: hypothetical protein C6496_13925 [Candidatus Poribacteria bacterium]
MDEKIQEQIDEQLKAVRQARLLDDGETSSAPVLDTAVLESDYKRSALVEIDIEGQTFQVEVLRGSPLTAALLLDRTPEVYALKERVENNPNREFTDEEIAEVDRTNRDFRRIMVASHVIKPPFSYKGYGDGHPVEDVSDTMLDALFEAYQVVNTPQEGADRLNRFPDVEPDGDGESTSD